MHDEKETVLAWDIATETITSMILHKVKDIRVKLEWVNNVHIGFACQMTPNGNIASHTYVKRLIMF